MCKPFFYNDVMITCELDLSVVKMASGCTKLPYRYLGNSGLKVSALCLGAMTFGQREVRNEPTVRSELDVECKLVGVVAMQLP